jgi:hypothetical protein
VRLESLTSSTSQSGIRAVVASIVAEEVGALEKRKIFLLPMKCAHLDFYEEM